MFSRFVRMFLGYNLGYFKIRHNFYVHSKIREKKPQKHAEKEEMLYLRCKDALKSKGY